MKIRLAVALALSLFAAGCQPKTTSESSDSATAENSALSSEPKSPSKQAPSASQTNTPLIARLAYAFSYDLKAPAAQLSMLLHKHEQACIAAGPLVCQVLSERASALGRDDANAELVLRAVPAWLDGFRANIDGEVRAAGGSIASNSVETEDLTRSLVDTEAALRAKRALRDQLQGRLEHDKRDPDPNATAQSLQEAQTALDTTNADLKVMQTRAQMAKLTIAYRSSASLSPDSAFAPLAAAGHSFLSRLILSLSFVVTALAYISPLLLVGGGITWLLSRKRRPSARDSGRPDA